MKIATLTSLSIIILFMAACSAARKTSTTTTVTTTPAPTENKTTSPSADGGFMFLKPTLGMHAPGMEELTAIQVRFKEVTMDLLKQGHFIYTAGACIKCHETGSVYDRNEEQWQHIIDDMAIKANITEEEKDAVYKYVLALKATQPK